MISKLLEVNKVNLTILKSNPPQLSMTVFGSAPTLGWSNAQLSPYLYLLPPKDGIYDFDFVACPPSEPAGK